MSTDKLYIIGINGATGGYLTPPRTPAMLARRFLEGARPPEERSELRWRLRRTLEGTFAIREDSDPANLAEARYGGFLWNARIAAQLAPGASTPRSATAGPRARGVTASPYGWCREHVFGKIASPTGNEGSR